MTGPLFSTFEAVMKARVLRYAVGQAIFCPQCDSVLDCRRAVLVDVEDYGHSFMEIACSRCYDARVRERIEPLVLAQERAAALAAVQETLTGDHPKPPLQVEVTDGREVDWELEEVCPR